MGKASYSPLGQWRNKVGGQIYRIDSGEQIVSAYQPVVKNPRTESQVTNRTKFTSATRYIAGFKPFIDVMNPTGSRRRVRAEIMKKVMATMTGTTISQTTQNDNLVINKSDLISVSVNAASGSGNQYVVTGAVILAPGVEPSDFVGREVTAYFGIQFLNAEGTVMRRTVQSNAVAISSTLEFTFEIDFDDTNITGALYEAGIMGVLTSEAWSRFSRANAISDNNTSGSLSEYSESLARQFSGNAGRGVLRS